MSFLIGLLQASMITLYTTYLTWSALSYRSSKFKICIIFYVWRVYWLCSLSITSR